MADVPKIPTVSEMLKQAVSDVKIKNQKINEDPFNQQSTIISAKQLDVDRFSTYTSKTYGKLGFDPFKDNNKIYNNKTNWSEDVGRAWRGMAQLAGVGFQDTFAFGLTAEKENWKDFDDVMKNYSSSRGGYTQFWSNTMLSSGYTVGILGAIAAEEIGLAVTTGGLGNIGTAGVVGMQLGKAFDKLGKLTRGSKYIERIGELGHADEAAKFFSFKGAGQNLGKLAQKLSPVAETADYLRKTKLDELSDFNSFQKLSLGAGALARDARKIYMTHSESQLEAKLAKNEFVNKQIQLARKNSPDGLLSEEDSNKIDTDAANVYNSTYMGNLGLIYMTNAITFDNMFKSMRYSNKIFTNAGQKFTTTLSKGKGIVTKAVKNATIKSTFQAGKKAVTSFSPKASLASTGKYVVKNYKVAGANLIKKGLSNSMEGIQELGQDVISNSVQSYYGRNHAGQQVRGGFLENMWLAASEFSLEDTGKAIVNMATSQDKDGNTIINQEGLSTFGSGFFMGTFAAPFGGSMGYIQKQIVGGGAKSKAEFLFNREAYIKKQKTKYRESVAKAKVLTQIFNDNLGSFIDHTENSLVTQAELQEQILAGIQENDKKKVEDKKHDSFQQGMKTLLKNNSEGMFTDFLEDMVNNYSPEQMNQAMGRTDITNDNVAEYKAKLNTKVATIKFLRKKQDEINETVVNPVRQSDIDRLDSSDPEQRKEKLNLIIYKKAYDNLKDELLFNSGKISNKTQRLIELEKQISKETGLTATEVQSFISKQGLSNELKVLQTQVNGNKNLNLTGEDLKLAKLAEQKLEALTAYQLALNNIEKLESAEEPSFNDIDDAYSDLFEAYHSYRSVDPQYGLFYGKEESEEIKRAISRKSFDAIVDYLDLTIESQALQDVVNTLMDPRSATMWIDRNAEMMADLDKNKEMHITNQLNAFQDKALSSELLTELQEAGIFFDLNELDDLIDKGIMPSEIYNIESNKPASKEEYQKAQDLISKFYKKLKGKTITQDKSAGSKRSLRYSGDNRTVKGLLRQYGITLNKEIDLSDPKELDKLLRKLNKSNFLTYIDKELLDKVSDSSPKIMFVDNAEFPISINEDGVYLIDIRYAGSDYKNVVVNFETLILSALTQAKLNDNLNNNPDLKAEVENLMQQAKDAFIKNNPNLDIDKISVFNNVSEFLSESLNNTSFQSFLGGITDTISGNKESLWKSMMVKIMKAFKQTFDKSILQRAVSLSNMALDESITDNINEKSEEEINKLEINKLENELENLKKQKDVVLADKNTDLDEEIGVGNKQTLREKKVFELDTLIKINELELAKLKPTAESIDEKLIKEKNKKLEPLEKEIADLEKQIEELIKTGAGKGFKNFLNETELSEKTKTVLEFIYKNFPSISENVKFIADQKTWDDALGKEKDNYNGFYADNGKGGIVILLNPNKYTDETVLHELIHAFTQVILDNPSNAAEKEYVASIKDLFEEFKKIKNTDLNYNYIFNDISEFITYTMSNTEFQDFLNKNEKTKTAFEKFIVLLKKMFGIAEKTTVDKVIAATQNIINVTDYSNIQERVLQSSSGKGQESDLQNKKLNELKEKLAALKAKVDQINEEYSKQLTQPVTEDELLEEEDLETVTEPTQSEEEQLINEETKLKTEINQKRELLKRVNEQIDSTKKLQFRKRIKLDKQKTQLLFDLKDLQSEYDDKFGSEKIILPEETTAGGELPIEEVRDIDNNLIITERTPFRLLPAVLQNQLIEQYRIFSGAKSVGAIRNKYKSEIVELEALNRQMAQANDDELDALDEKFGEIFDKLVKDAGSRFTIRLNEESKIEINVVTSDADASEQEIDDIQEAMFNEMAFIRTIIEYNKSMEPVEPEVVVELSDVEIAAYNTAQIERGKQLGQERIDLQREESRARSRARRQSIVPINAMEREQVAELLKKVLKDDFDILTKSDLKYLTDNLLNDSKTFRFKIPDVIAFVSKKKLQLEQDSQIQQVNEIFAEELDGVPAGRRAELVLGYQKDIYEGITDNSVAYNYGLLSKYVKSKEPIKVSYNNKKYSFTLTATELKALALYNKDLFSKSLNTKEDEESFLIRIHTIMQNVKYYAAEYKKNLKFTGTPEQIEQDVVKLFNKLKADGILLPSVVRAVNYALYDSKSKLTIARVNALSGSIYVLEAREGLPRKVQPKNKLAKDKETIGDYVYESGLPVTDPLWQEALIAYWFTSSKNRVHPDFIRKNITKGKSEIAFYKSFISAKSQFKTADGLADEMASDFSDRLQDLGINLQNEIIDVFGNYKSISEMISSIADRINESKNLDNGEYESDLDFENWISTDGVEKANDDLNEYINSLEFKITTGQLDLASTDYASLTPSQQLLFDQAAEEGLYRIDDAESANDAANLEIEFPEEIASGVSAVNLKDIQLNQTAVDKVEQQLSEEMDLLLDRFYMQPALISRIEDIENDTNLKLFIAAYRLTNKPGSVFTEKQKVVLNDRLNKKLESQSFVGQSIVNDAVHSSPLQILSFNTTNKTVELVDFTTGESFTISIEEFSKAQDVFEGGEEYTKLNLNTVVNDQEIDYIKEAYQNIFNNFTTSVVEFEKLENAELNSKVLEQLTKCK